MSEKQNETKKCKHCQSDIPKKAKVCPNCRKEQGGALKWVLVAVLLVCIFGGVAGSDEKPTKVNDTTSSAATTSSTETNAEEIFTVGDTVEYRNVRVTLDAVEESNGSQYNTPTNGNVFLLVKFTIENNTDTDLAISSLLSFDAYQDGYATNFSINALVEKTGNQLDGTIAPGKKMQGYIGYEVPADYKEFEVNFKADLTTTTKFNFVYKK